MKAQRALPVVAILGLALLLYGRTIGDYFLQDDFGVVGLLSSKPATFFPRWFTMPWMENIWGYLPDEIRPFPALSYQIAAVFGAGSPVPNHLINIGLHALNAWLVLAIAQEAAGLGLVAATFAALVFVVLPIEAESVAWVTGRVDSFPAFFYFASFLLFVRWRATGQSRCYAWSLALFFVALFSKQNTITMAPALVLYDLILGRRRVSPTWAWLRPYAPYVLLTVGFLGLRYLLFNEVAREGILNAARVREFLSDSSRHLVRLVFGGDGVRHWETRDTVIVAAATGGLSGLAVLSRPLAFAKAAAGRQAPARWRSALYFGIVWLGLGIAPILMSGYYSPRHMYLASLGWAIALGLAFEIVWAQRPARSVRPLAAVVAIALLVSYAGQLRDVVDGWSHRAALSRQALTDVEREAASARAGTLLLVGVPTDTWAFAAPHAFRPPFAARDLTRDVKLVTDSSLHCCAAELWMTYTREAIRSWQEDPSRPPVVAMYWEPRTLQLSRVSDTDDPQLRTLVDLLMKTDSRETLDSAIRGLLRNFVAVR